MSGLKKYGIPLILFIIAIIARTAFFYIAYENHGRDLLNSIVLSDGYYEIAENLLAGHGFSDAAAFPFAPGAERMPLYPLLIAGIVYLFKSYWAVLALQIIVASVIPIIGWQISRLITESERLSFYVGFALALEPFSIMLSDVLLTETLFTIFFLVAIFFFLKYLQLANRRNVILAAIFLGLATLTKPTIQFLPFLLAPLIIWRSRSIISLKRSAAHLLIFIGLFALTLVPWMYRNHEAFGQTFLTVQSTKNLYMYLTPSVIALDTGIGFEEAKKQFYAAEQQKGINTEDLYLPQHQAEFGGRAAAELIRRPIGLFKSFAITAIAFFTHDGYLGVIQQLGYMNGFRQNIPAIVMLFKAPAEFLQTLNNIPAGPAIFVALGRAVWAVLTILFAVGLFRYFQNGKEKRAVAWLMLIIVAYFAATSAVVGLGINARFRTPINTFIFIFALYGAKNLWLLLKDKKFAAEKISKE